MAAACPDIDPDVPQKVPRKVFLEGQVVPLGGPQPMSNVIVTMSLQVGVALGVERRHLSWGTSRSLVRGTGFPMPLVPIPTDTLPIWLSKLGTAPLQ